MSVKWTPKRVRAADNGGVPKFLRVKDDGRGNDYVYILNQQTGDVDDVWFLRTERDKERFRREADIADLDKEVPGQYQFADSTALGKVTNWRLASNYKDAETKDPSFIVSAHAGKKFSAPVSSVDDAFRRFSYGKPNPRDYPVLYRDNLEPGKKNVRQREMRVVPTTDGQEVTAPLYKGPLANYALLPQGPVPVYEGAETVTALSPQEWRKSVGKVMASEGKGLYGRYAYTASLAQAANDEDRARIYMDRARVRYADLKRLKELAGGAAASDKDIAKYGVKLNADGSYDWQALADRRAGEHARLQDEFRGEYSAAFDSLVAARRQSVFKNIVAPNLEKLGYKGVTYEQFAQDPRFAKDYEGMKSSDLMRLDEWAQPFDKAPEIWHAPASVTPAEAAKNTIRSAMID